MNDHDQQQKRIDALLAHDPAVSSFQFEEFHVRLEASIKRLEQRALTLNRASFWGLGVIVACVLSTPLLKVSGLFDDYEWVRFIWTGCGVLALITTGVLTTIYTYKYRPAIGSSEK